jgi:hypothetical protein
MSALADILNCTEVARFAAASLLILGGSTWQILRLSRQYKQLTAAVGLCMWDGDLRLVDGRQLQRQRRSICSRDDEPRRAG